MEKNRSPKKRGVGPGIAALITGVIALIFFLSFVNVPLAITAIVLGAIGIAQYEKKLASIAGMICGVLSLVMMIGGYYLMFSNENLARAAMSMYTEEGIRDYYELLEEYGVGVDPALEEMLEESGMDEFPGESEEL
ncbi:MAG: DUF4190 domain-containing protein [Lachnospiraceae bacterium]|nr:DUF4190 domain-containing protein [Lachnospiraceae bacterium]